MLAKWNGDGYQPLNGLSGVTSVTRSIGSRSLRFGAAAVSMAVFFFLLFQLYVSVFLPRLCICAKRRT